MSHYESLEFIQYPSQINPYAQSDANKDCAHDEAAVGQLRVELDANYEFAKSAAKKREKKEGPRDPRVKRRGLVIGINYHWLPIGDDGIQRGYLAGCNDDADNFKELLVKNYGFKDKDVILMTDRPLKGQPDWSLADNPTVPTIRRVKETLRDITEDMRPGDCMVIYFSGHGDNVKDKENESLDGKDAVLLLPDRKKGNTDIVFLKDDWLYANVVKALPKGCKLTAIFDCCHSGGALDLNWEMDTTRNDKNGNITCSGKWKDVMSKKNAEVDVDATLISGCRTDEGSAEQARDLRFDGRQDNEILGDRGGMLTTELIKILSRKPYDYSYESLIADTAYRVFQDTKLLNEHLNKKYGKDEDVHPQLPVLSSSLKFGIERKFGFDETTGILKGSSSNGKARALQAHRKGLT